MLSWFSLLSFSEEGDIDCRVKRLLKAKHITLFCVTTVGLIVIKKVYSLRYENREASSKENDDDKNEIEDGAKEEGVLLSETGM